MFTMSSVLEARQRKDDLEVIVTYIKMDLYPKVKFIYDVKKDLVVGGPIYNHYKDKCKNKIGIGRTRNEASQETYMESVWTLAMTKHLQRNALSQKRSAVYTVMQSKFTGEQQMSMLYGSEKQDY